MAREEDASNDDGVSVSNEEQDAINAQGSDGASASRMWY